MANCPPAGTAILIPLNTPFSVAGDTVIGVPSIIGTAVLGFPPTVIGSIISIEPLTAFKAVTDNRIMLSSSSISNVSRPYNVRVKVFSALGIPLGGGIFFCFIRDYYSVP